MLVVCVYFFLHCILFVDRVYCFWFALFIVVERRAYCAWFAVRIVVGWPWSLCSLSVSNCYCLAVCVVVYCPVKCWPGVFVVWP